MIELDEDFETMLICAERYACGRRSYMPSIVIGYITPLVPRLSNKTLAVMCKDIIFAAEHGGLGDPDIDDPLWRRLHCCIAEELSRRAES